jgi:hypothetical protein
MGKSSQAAQENIHTTGSSLEMVSPNLFISGSHLKKTMIVKKNI